MLVKENSVCSVFNCLENVPEPDEKHFKIKKKGLIQ